MGGVRPRVNIGYCGDDAEDSSLAESIGRRISDLAAVRLLDFDAIERDPKFSVVKANGGTNVYILSERLLNDPKRRERLVASAPSRNLPGRFTGYICRGKSRDEVQKLYPDIKEKIFRDVMVGDESQLDDLIHELRQSLCSPSAHLRAASRWALLLGVVASSFIGLVALLAGPIGTMIGVPAMIGAWLSLLSTSPVAAERYIFWALAFYLGLTLSRVPALDLHPWIDQADRRRWDEKKGLRDWAGFLWLTRGRLTFRFLLAVIPACVIATDASPGALHSALLLFLIGCLLPVLAARASAYMRRVAYWSSGLKKPELTRTDRYFFDYGRARRYQRMPVYSSYRVRRAWLLEPNRVFISYSWADEEREPVAQRLAGALESGGIRPFLDRRFIHGAFTAWRTPIVSELLTCTHFFLVVGGDVLNSQVVLDELRTVLQRWETEVFPAIICIVDPDVAERVLASRGVETPLKYVLENCPRLRADEIADPETVCTAVEARRYRGLIRDWLTIAWPRARLTPWARDVTRLSFMSEVSCAGLLLWLSLCVFGIVNPSRVASGGPALLWKVETTGASWSRNRANLGPMPVPVMKIGVTAPEALVSFHHRPNSPSLHRYASLLIRARLEHLSAADLTIGLRSGNGGDGTWVQPFTSHACAEPTAAGWSCARIPIETFHHPGGALTAIDLRVSGAGGDSILWLKDIELIRAPSSPP